MRALVGAMICCSAALFAQSGTAPVKACAVLMAQSASAQVDTARIQSALNLCSPGRAVVLKTDGPRRDFESAPLTVPRGVTLFVDRGVTLKASRHPRDYDLAPGSCGAPAEGRVAQCTPFVFAYQAAFSGIVGGGVIDGQGAAWWDMVRSGEKAGKPIAVPDLVSSYESQGFKVVGITLRNAAGVHAAIYKTPALAIAGLIIDTPMNAAASTGLLLSNTAGGQISGLWIRVPAEAIAVKASILGGTSNVTIRDAHVFGGRGISIGDEVYGDVHAVTFDGVSVDGASTALSFNLKGTAGGKPRQNVFAGMCVSKVSDPLRVIASGADVGHALPAGVDVKLPDFAAAPACPPTPFTPPEYSASVDATDLSNPGTSASLVVSPEGDGFRSIQKAIDALPLKGGEITVHPGTYREVVTIRKPHVHLRGSDADPTKTVIVYNNGAVSSGGTFNSSTVFVEADDVTIDHLSIVNDLGSGKGQAVALHVTADRAVFRNLRITGAQDTLFAASKLCYGDYGPCVAARQYFADSYIEGNTDFIFGDSMAVFERCEIHGVDSGTVMYTAQSRHTEEQRDSGYVFDHCRLTGAARERGAISLGRPWRPYATVVFLNTIMEAPVIPAGWTEWARFGKPSLPTTYYAEFNSSGPGAEAASRDLHSHQLTAAEADKWAPLKFLAGRDGWNPERK